MSFVRVLDGRNYIKVVVRWCLLIGVNVSVGLGCRWFVRVFGFDVRFLFGYLFCVVVFGLGWEEGV